MASPPKVEWETPGVILVLPEDEVHVWRADLRLPPRQIDELRLTLSPDEVARANRFRFDIDRSDYIVSRGVLRSILSGYLGLSAGELVFCYSRFGKPALALKNTDIQFNLSRSKGLALFAVTLRRAVGIDVEFVDTTVDDASIVERYFSESEIATWKSLSPSDRPQAFFNAWTRKEAVVKAIGEGLSIPLNSFDVTLAPGEAGRIIRPTPFPWSLTCLPSKDGYTGAFVVMGDDWHLRCFDWHSR